MQINHFLNMIKNLRQNEEILLYNNVLDVSDEHANEVINFLNQEYQKECLNYPNSHPKFNEDAALWAAKIIYNAAQLLLYRQHKETDLTILLPDYNKLIDAEEILSADLTLRFLPDIIAQLKFIDTEDKLIEILDSKLEKWHFSAVNYALDFTKLDFTSVIKNQTVLQLYCDKIIKYKNHSIAKHFIFKEKIDACLGLYANEFWNNYKLETQNNE